MELFSIKYKTYSIVPQKQILDENGCINLPYPYYNHIRIDPTQKREPK